jgi:hypothetical protein
VDVGRGERGKEKSLQLWKRMRKNTRVLLGLVVVVVVVLVVNGTHWWRRWWAEQQVAPRRMARPPLQARQQKFGGVPTSQSGEGLRGSCPSYLLISFESWEDT